jgi:hypothetical protein
VKQFALEASLCGSELGPTKKEAPDGGLKEVEVLLSERAAILFCGKLNSSQQLALGRLKHLFAGGGSNNKKIVELRCHPSRSVRIWKFEI